MIMDLVDPGARQIRQGVHVDLGCQPLGLEPPHLAAGSCRTIEPLTADDGTHRGVVGKSLGVVHVLVAGEPTEHRLAEQTAQVVACVTATAAVEELRDRHVGEPKGVVQLAVGEKAAIRGDPCSLQLELDPAVEGDPEARHFRFTRRVRHPRLAPPALSL